MITFGKNRSAIKIAYISPHDIKGGASKIGYYLFQGFREKGYNVRFFVGKKSLDDFDIEQLIKHKTKFSKIVGKIIKRANRELGFEHFFYPNSSNTIMSWKPDLIHFHNIQGNYFDLRKIKEISKKIPILFTLHDPWMFAGHCSYFIECEKWKSGCGNCPDLQRRPSLKRDGTAFNWNRKRAIYEKSKFYIASPSNWLLNEVNKSIIKKGVQKATLINNGVDHEVFKPMDKTLLRKKLKITENEVVLLYVVSSNITTNPYKDFNTISKCIHYIQKNKDSSKKFTLIAIGEEKPETSTNGVRKISIGYINSAEEMAGYFNIADLYLHAARAENYPNVVMEALSAGTPCIVTNTGGVPEQIIENETGWVVPFEDYKAMALKVIELSNEPTIIKEAGQRARKWIEDNHTLRHMLKDYHKYYKTILNDIKLP